MCSVEFYFIFFFSNGNVSIVFRYFITEKYTEKQKVRRLDARGHRYYRRNNNQKNLIIRAENIFRIIEKPDRIVRSVWVFHEIVKYRFFHFFFSLFHTSLLRYNYVLLVPAVGMDEKTVVMITIRVTN